MARFSIVVGYRDRELTRAERFLRSLAEQRYGDHEVVFVDYGSSEEFAGQAASLCARYAFCRYLYNDTYGRFWNRSHALNTGIRAADSDFVICTDIDMIFAPDVLERVAHVASTDCQYFSQVFLLPSDFRAYETLFTDAPAYKLTNRSGMGGFHCTAKATLEEVRGFDEFYCIWGKEDQDLASRLAITGLETRWLEPEEVRIFHQWHKPSMNRNLTFPQWWWDKMSIHYASLQETPVRNTTRAWGKLWTREERVVLNDAPQKTLELAPVLNAYERAQAIEDIFAFARTTPDSVLEILTAEDYAVPVQPSILERLKGRLGMEGATRQKSHSTSTFLALQYLLLELLSEDGLLRDYAIVRDAGNAVRFKLAFGKRAEISGRELLEDRV